MIKKAELYKTVYRIDQLPPEDKPEVAFAGRSNVGKSSLLNSLMKIKIAKTSSKPGKTRSINYYLVNDNYYFVDLPGYGFASVAKTEREKWNELMNNYFINRMNLKMVYVLIDHRHKPQKNDHMMIQWLKSLNMPFMIVLTKSDKLNQSEKIKKLNEIKNELSVYGEYIYFQTSANKNKGIEELTNSILAFLK
ncbi:ribosome biogenesis GTP-binding protein YihA/YsxC [Geotoga petraea]|jgi:GTP-binding protein|uniref:Probable GTP-binding protein EngB n=1 Tax=Geotoga petraea TaxID=28234 RepID=A0A1G6IBD4_9BACT|nr:ribosome biogenesis GTP-binding protein YihA/YsxC [Geotoga petraea]MDK2945600.1 GTP-binding protein [Geotoga sp.]TGG89153.1 YihA family ribosome biogenesis GTP-binding protein [Geotoga petraea]SDC03791.1 GTP-binding protein [Geotoga petraea]